jgi:hypothetical protein
MKLLVAIGKDTNGSVFYYNVNTGKYVYRNGKPFNRAKRYAARSSSRYGFGHDVNGKAIFSTNGEKWFYTNGTAVPMNKVLQSPYPIRPPR